MTEAATRTRVAVFFEKPEAQCSLILDTES